MMNNPHRFPRPPTLPQSKIQIKTQRDPKSVDTVTPPTFASMLGRNLGGSTVAFVGAEDPITPGVFTTSFDLLSIAKVVPAKRRISNPVTILEGQTPDRNVLGEQSTENQSGDWPRYITSTAGFGTFTSSQNQDTPKSMIFRRQGTASSTKPPISHNRSDATLQPNQIEDVKDGQPKGIAAEENVNSSNEIKENSLLNVFRGKETEEVSEELEDSSRTDSFPTPGPLRFTTQENSLIKEGTEFEDSQNPKGIAKEMTGVAERELVKPELLQLVEPLSADETQVSRSPILESNQSLSHMAAAKNMNDGLAILRAAAIPFEPKQVKKDPSSSLSAKTGIDDISRNRSQNESFTNLSDKFYGKTFDPSGEGSETPSREQHQWFVENSHHRLQMAIQNSGGELSLGSLGLGNKRARLSDAAISQLWDDHESGGDVADSLDTNGGQLDQNCVDQLISGETIVPMAGGTPVSALQDVEHLELRALDISQRKDDITHKVYETLIDGFLKNPATDHTTAEVGRRGSVTTIKTARDGVDSCNPDGGRFKRPTLEAQRKELTEAKGGEEWWKNFLEPTSDVEIRMRSEGNDCKEVEKDWLYPYPRTEGKETVATELTLALYQQLLGYLIPPVSNGVVSEINYWSFGARKIGSRHFSGREPWYTKDYTSFFDMSFGTIPRNRSGKVTINPPPGLSLAPVSHGKEGQQNNIDSEKSVGLKDLVEGSIPDFNSFIPGNYTTREAKTLQEWNATPIKIDTDTPGNINKDVEIPRKSFDAPSWNETRGDGKGGGGKTSGPSNSILNREMSKLKALVHNSGVDLRGSIECMLNMRHTDEDLKELTAQQKSDVFGGARKMGKIVFGSDDESV